MHEGDEQVDGEDLPGTDSVRLAVLGFCGCFNEGRYYEAHDVLEVVWLPVRRTVEGELWKGLIQLAAAFVHVQRGRRGPALALLRSARQRLERFGSEACLVDLGGAAGLAKHWEGLVERSTESGLADLLRAGPPRLSLCLS